MINLEKSFWTWIEEEGGLEDFVRSRMNIFILTDENTGEDIETVYFTPENEYHGYSEEQAVQAEMSWLMSEVDQESDSSEEDEGEDEDEFSFGF